MKLYLTSICTTTDFEAIHSRYLHYTEFTSQEQARAQALRWWSRLVTSQGVDAKEFLAQGYNTMVPGGTCTLMAQSPDYYSADHLAIKVEECEIAYIPDDEQMYFKLNNGDNFLPIKPLHAGVLDITGTQLPELIRPDANGVRLTITDKKVGVVMLTGQSRVFINHIIGREDIFYWQEFEKPNKVAEDLYKSHTIRRREVLAPFTHLRPDILVSRPPSGIYGLKNSNSITAGPVTYRFGLATVCVDSEDFEYLMPPFFHNYIIPRYCDIGYRGFFKEYFR